MKILLISPNALTSPYPVYPLGLDYVADAIRADHDVKIADINQFGTLDALGEIIEAYQPEIVGISLRNIDNTDKLDPSDFMGEYQACVRTVRRHSRAPLVLGGSGFTLFPEEIMKRLKADYGVLGEGEKLRDLLEGIKAGADISAIPGIMTRDTHQGSFVPFKQAFPLNFVCARSQLAYYLKNGGMLNLQTKRGCPYQCIYCTYPRIEGDRLRRIPPDLAAERALCLEESGAKYFFVTDSAFNADYDHSARVARAFKHAGVSIPWGAFFAPTHPPEGYYQTLADAGLSHVEFGTESLSNTMLRVYKKPFYTEDVFQAHNAALAAGLYVAHYFMFGGPGETEETIEHTLSRIAELNKSVFFFFALCASIPIPRSMIWRLKQARYRHPRAF